MDKGREKEVFVTIKIKATTAEKFRTFCKKNAASQSMGLLQMIHFFEFNGIAPTDNLGDSIAKLEGKINKRTNAIIAIIKDIEKNQTKPTTAMLLSLFEEKAIQQKPKLVEVKIAKVQTDKEPIEVTVSKMRYDRLERKMISVKKDFIYVMDKVKVVKKGFGKDYLKLELTESELVKFRRRINNY